MRSHSYLNTAKEIIQSYDGNIPFSIWLKQFFKTDKKFGSRDRKLISHLCFCYYRLGNAFHEKDFEERLLMGQFLCSDEDNFILWELKENWNEEITKAVEEKLKLVNEET